LRKNFIRHLVAVKRTDTGTSSPIVAIADSITQLM
jgi:hypothetical protein